MTYGAVGYGLWAWITYNAKGPSHPFVILLSSAWISRPAFGCWPWEKKLQKTSGTVNYYVKEFKVRWISTFVTQSVSQYCWLDNKLAPPWDKEWGENIAQQMKTT